MRKRLSKFMVSVLTLAMVLTSLPVNMLSVQAKQEEVKSVSDNSMVEDEMQEMYTEEVALPVYQTTSGTFGGNDGFRWSYDENTKTLTVTGTDGGLNYMQDALPESVLENMRNIVFQDCWVMSSRLENLLCGLDKIESVVFQEFHTINVEYMGEMFYGCSSLKTLDVTDFDTSNVMDMGSMFYGCSSLETLDVSGFDTSNVNNMNEMFYGCSSLEILDVSNFNTRYVDNMYKMFSDCNSLKSVNVSGFDTSGVTDMSDMFYNCSSLETIATPNVMAEKQIIELPDVFCDSEKKKITEINFEHCNKVLRKAGETEEDKNIGVFGDNNGFSWNYDESTSTLTVTGDDSGLNTMKSILPETVLENVRNVIFQDCVVSGSMEKMLSHVLGLESVEFYNCDTSNVTDMSGMFFHCTYLSSLDLSGLDTSNVTDMSSMFNDCSKLRRVDVNGLDTSNVTDMSNMFSYCTYLSSLDLSGLETNNVTDMSNMFVGCSNLSNMDLSGFDTRNVMDMSYMFKECSYLKSLDLSGLETNNVTNMGHMFEGCSNLESLDVSNFDTSNVTSMFCMFFGCNKIHSLDLSNFDTSNVTNMSEMFRYCFKLSSLDLIGFDTSNVKYMNYMFEVCGNLESLELSDFDTSNVVEMRNLFSGCRDLRSLDLSSFDTSNVVDMKYMFNNCNNLGSVKTPKRMVEGQMIELPVLLYDAEDNGVTEITSIHCNKTLTRLPTEYTITYYLDGGKNDASNPLTYTKSTATITLKAPKRLGYAFGGWYMDSNFLTKVTQITNGSIGNKVLYAKWTPIKYTIMFNKNGSDAKGTMKNMTNREYGKSYKLTKNAFKRTGYTFKGWSTTKSGNVKYKNAASVKNLVAINGATVTLYAKWEANKYTIKFNKNAKDATGTMKNMTNRQYGKSYKLTKNTFKRKGYTFKGWSTIKKGKVKYKNNAKVKNLVSKNKGSITLYAVWKEK